MRSWITPVFLALVLARSALAADAPGDPSGRWTTIDDVTGKSRSIVEITVVGGVAQGTIVRVFPRPGDTGFCQHCSGALKGARIVGLTILSGVRADGEQWDGGSILDPDSGSTYDVRLRLQDGGQKLEVRGYLGISLLGRTQTWIRSDE